MSRHLEKAQVLRNEMAFPNCAQTILMAYSEELGLSDTQAKNLGTNLGGGMKIGSTCGVVTSSLVVLGGLGINDPRIVAEFQNKIKNNHNGLINCTDLLKENAKQGLPKKTHCDKMIEEAILLIEEYSK